MRILVGTICRTDPQTLAAHLKSMRWQKVDPSVRVDLVYIDDNLDPQSSEVLADFADCVLEPGERPEGALYGVSSETHQWSVPTFHFLAREKQRLFDRAVAENYDAVFLVDSDLLLDPSTLQSLIATEKDVVSACFWTQWTPADPPLPQVWNQHPYGFDGAGWRGSDFLSRLRSRELVRVRGLGACTLIRRSALERGLGFWPLVDGLPSEGMWQGEDRHFCVRAERLHIELWCDAWPNVAHVYRPEDRAEIDAWMSAHEVESEGVPLPGDWVSIAIEPCEEPQLALHRELVRGRLGLLRVLPEIEEALFSMRVGESKFVTPRFPIDYPIEAYRGQRRALRIHLLGAKPHTP